MLSRMSDRRVPLVVVLQQQSTTAAWGSGRNVHDAGMQVVSGDELLASRRAARTTILYDVTAIKFPSMALRGSAATAAVAAQAGSAGGSGDGGGAGAGSGSNRDDAAAGAAMDDGSPPNADAASLLLSPLMGPGMRQALCWTPRRPRLMTSLRLRTRHETVQSA